LAAQRTLNKQKFFGSFFQKRTASLGASMLTIDVDSVDANSRRVYLQPRQSTNAAGSV
jgi:hypothetical protein